MSSIAEGGGHAREAPPPSLGARLIRALTGWRDLDDVFSYDTYKIVTIRDARLGLIYWSCITIIVLYIMIKAFGIDRRHQEADPGLGTVMMAFKGKAYAKGDTNRVFDAADLRYPVIEPSGAFITTKRIIMPNQKQGSCVNWDQPQECPCSDGGVCNGDHCETQGWCPSLGDGNVDKPPKDAKVDEMEGLEDATLSIHAGIAFPFAGNYFFVASPKPGQPNLKNITIQELLSYARPPLKLSDLTHTGALIGVNLMWSCELTTFRNLMGDLGDVPTGLGEEQQVCPFYLSVSRLDGGQGFVQKRSRRKGDKRDAIYSIGLRIIVESSGVGQRVSLVLIVIQMGSMFSLLKMAQIFTDFLMARCFPDRERNAYKKCKVEDTDDYSDLKDRIPEVVKQRNQYRPASDAPAQMLGLGAGGRAGSGTAVLRGRR